MTPLQLQEGLARLSRGTYFREASLDVTLSLLTESAGQMSGAQRSSIWAFNSRRQELCCLELYEAAHGTHSSGARLLAERYPIYFSALAREEAIVADNPYLHPSTAEFGQDYLPAHGVMAILDTPIHVRGELQGVFRLEQVNAAVPWNSMQRLFAQAVANLVTLALVEHEAGEARRQAQTANERWQALFVAGNAAALLLDAASGMVLDANRRAESLFGCTRIELIGKQPGHLLAAASAEEGGREFRRLLERGGALATGIRRRDGAVVDVEVRVDATQAEAGRRLALASFRPL